MPSSRMRILTALMRPRFASWLLADPAADEEGDEEEVAAAAAWIILVFMASPGVTTAMDSATPALRPLTTLIHAARGFLPDPGPPDAGDSEPERASSFERVVSKARNRMPDFAALEAARAWTPE